MAMAKKGSTKRRAAARTALPKVASLPQQTHSRPQAERRAAGKALRDTRPRRAIANWRRSPRRADLVDLLIANSAGRVEQLVPVRDGRMIAISKPVNLVNYATARGWALTRAHEGSGDTAMPSGCMGSSEVVEVVEDAMAVFAMAYADQNERDHAALVAAVRSGRIEARVDV